MQYEILGLGAPALDSVLMVEDRFVDCLPGMKYGMQEVEYEDFFQLVQSSGPNLFLHLEEALAILLKDYRSLAAHALYGELLVKIGSGKESKKCYLPTVFFLSLRK